MEKKDFYEEETHRLNHIVEQTRERMKILHGNIHRITSEKNKLLRDYVLPDECGQVRNDYLVAVYQRMEAEQNETMRDLLKHYLRAGLAIMAEDQGLLEDQVRQIREKWGI